MKSIIRNINAKNKKKKDVLIMGTGGGKNGTVTKRAWKVDHYTNH